MKEYLLSVDKYNNPAVKTDKECIFYLLIRLILLNPGTIESHPDMGVGLIKNWRYSDMSQLPQLESEIQTQIETYLPVLQGVSVKVEQISHGEIAIYIKISNIIYSFKTDNGTLVELKGGNSNVNQ